MTHDPRKADQMKRRIAFGIWEDMNGDIHWSITELLELFQIEDTPENRARVEETIRDGIRKQRPEVKIVVREKPEYPDDYTTPDAH